MADSLGQRGDTYLAKLNSENIPMWARGMSLILTGLVGFILALGLDFGDIVNRYMDSRSQIETTTLSQSGHLEVSALTGLIDSNKGLTQLEVSALTGLIDSNKGLTQHVTDLILSINTLIAENKRLSEVNSELVNKNIELTKETTEQSELINKLNSEVRLELKE
jgi:hypothetical protein